MANGAPNKSKQFDLEKRLKERQARQILIGGREFHPSRETTETRAEDRRLGRDQARITTELGKLEDGTELDGLEELQVEQENVLYSIISNRLVDEQNSKPEIDWLAEHLPITEVTPLLEFLDGAEDTAAADPS